MRGLAAIMVTVAISGAHAGYPLPESSRLEAERQEEWRDMLERAERAVAEQRWDAAAELFSNVVEQARAADRRGMMLARALDGLADARQRAERYEEAENLYRESITLWERLLGRSQPRTGVSMYNLGMTYVALERFDEARGTLERALTIFESSLGPQSAQAANARLALERIEPADGAREAGD